MIDDLALRRILFRIACVCTALAGCLSVYAQSGATSVASIFKAWRHRQERIHSARVDWAERTAVPKGYTSRMLGLSRTPATESGIPAGSVVPPYDAVQDSTWSMSFEGAKVRCAFTRPEWSPSEARYVSLPNLDVFDGNTMRSLQSRGGPLLKEPQAIVTSQNSIRLVALLPVLTTFRPLDFSMHDAAIDKFTLTSRTDVIDERRCVELERRSSSVVRRAWLDPARDYVLVRWLTLVNDEIRTRVDVHYSQDASGEWIPDRWKYVQKAPDGNLGPSTLATMKAVQVNRPLPGDEFDVVYPEGTKVLEMLPGTPERRYVVNSQGSKMPVVSFKRAASSRASNSALQWSSVLFTSTAFWSAVLVVACAAGLVWRRRRRGASDPTEAQRNS